MTDKNNINTPPAGHLIALHTAARGHARPAAD